ncbi:MAG: hypothetical protein ACLP4V_06920 [Methylocella sp.]
MLDLAKDVAKLGKNSAPGDDKHAAILAKFDEDKRAYDAKLEASGLDAAEGRTRELYLARWNAEDAVLKRKPQTTAGAIALLMFAAEYLADDIGVSPCTLAPVFVNTAQAIAGDGAAVKISRPLQEVLDGERI